MTPMQPLGAPGTPTSPQALPYSAFPAPRIGQASAGAPATPIAPLIQGTQAQINDALSAARGPQPAPQLAAQPPQQRPQQWPNFGQGALGMMAGMMGHNQQPSPWGSMFSGQPQSPQQQSPFGGFFQPGRDGAGMGGFGMIPPQLRDLLGGNQQRFWGGFNWNGQQGAQDGRSPDPRASTVSFAEHAPMNYGLPQGYNPASGSVFGGAGGQ